MNPNLSTSYQAFQLDHVRRVAPVRHVDQATAARPVRSAMGASRVWLGSLLMNLGARVQGVPDGARIHEFSSSHT